MGFSPIKEEGMLATLFSLTILIVFNDELQIILLVFTRRKLQTLGDQVIRVALYITTVMFVIPAPCIYYRQVRNIYH